jgi:hypothetical protein
LAAAVAVTVAVSTRPAGKADDGHPERFAIDPLDFQQALKGGKRGRELRFLFQYGQCRDLRQVGGARPGANLSGRTLLAFLVTEEVAVSALMGDR